VATSSYLINPATNPKFAPLRVIPPILFDRFDISTPRDFYYLCLAVLAVAVLLARNFRRTRAGRAVLAARDNERFASALSISVVRVKLMAFAFSGALAGLAGGLYVLAVRGIPFGGFSPELSLQLFTMVVVGGLTSIAGAVLGALYVYFSQYFLSGAAQLFATGAGLLVVLMIAPGGLAETLRRARDWGLRWAMRRRQMSVPGFHHTTEAADGDVKVTDAPTPAPAQDRGAAGLLQCDELCAGYGHLQILFGVDIDVPGDAIMGLLGTNGAGKTTALKAIVGTVPNTGGRVIFDGEDITSLGPLDRVGRGIVMVPAKGVFGSLTVRENLRLAGWIPRHAGDDAYLDSTMERVFALFPVLQQRLDQRAALLSGGEQQMLAIAQGLLARPRLLLIDELSLGLAPVAVAAILEVIRELNRSGLPIVVVEQSINLSSTIADTSVFMEKGRVRFTGSTDELLHRDKLVRSVFFGDRSTGTRTSPRTADAGARRNGHTDPTERRATLQVEGVTKTYGAVTAVDQLDLTIYAGEILGVIGSNGAGKTTAFDIFSGFINPDAGTMVYNGIDVTRTSAARRAALGFGRTFQDVRLLPSLTTAETIAVSLERHTDVREPVASIFYVDATARSEHAVRRRADEIMEAFGLARYRDTCVADLSTGTRRVLELACVAAHRPRLLLLDEPSSGLSQAETEQMAATLRELAGMTGATLAIIEHDVPLVAELSDELICMELGRVIARGKPEAVLTNSEVVRSYLGTDQATIARSGSRPAPRRATPVRARP
jgi:ABC-type branched-subunit amino acid transport system ATPase component